MNLILMLKFFLYVCLKGEEVGKSSSRMKERLKFWLSIREIIGMVSSDLYAGSSPWKQREGDVEQLAKITCDFIWKVDVYDWYKHV